ARRSDDRWWYGLVDAAADLAEADPEAFDDEAARFLSAHESFVRRGIGAGFRADVHGHVLGLADATATHLRTGRPDRAVRCAGRLYDSARRLR
ncbi:MAG: hypothetical protein ABIS47_06515, partial [Acidimicrobiales bacterium]